MASKYDKKAEEFINNYLKKARSSTNGCDSILYSIFTKYKEQTQELMSLMMKEEGKQFGFWFHKSLRVAGNTYPSIYEKTVKSVAVKSTDDKPNKDKKVVVSFQENEGINLNTIVWDALQDSKIFWELVEEHNKK